MKFFLLKTSFFCVMFFLMTVTTIIAQRVSLNAMSQLTTSSKTSLKMFKPDQILGKWMSEEKDMTVEIFKVKDQYAAKVVWFWCDPKTPDMAAFKDTENPDPKLRDRPWLGMVVVNDLKFNGENAWEGGSIYDPNSGRTYQSVVRLKSPTELVVRGYWGIELFGKNLTFNKIQ